MKGFLPSSPWCEKLYEFNSETEFIRFFKRMEIENNLSSKDIEEQIELWRKNISILEKIQKKEKSISDSEFSEEIKNLIIDLFTNNINFYEGLQYFFNELNNSKAQYSDFNEIFKKYILFLKKQKRILVKEYFLALFFPIRVILAIFFSCYVLSTQYFEEWPAWVQIYSGTFIWFILFIRTKNSVFLVKKIYLSFKNKFNRSNINILIALMFFCFLSIKLTFIFSKQIFEIKEFILTVIFYELFYILLYSIIYYLILFILSIFKKNVSSIIFPISDVPSLTIIVPTLNTRNYISFEELIYTKNKKSKSIFNRIIENNLEDFMIQFNKWENILELNYLKAQFKIDRNIIKKWIKDNSFIKIAKADKNFQSNIVKWCNKHISSIRNTFSGLKKIIEVYNEHCSFQNFGTEYFKLSINDKKEIDKIVSSKLKIFLFNDPGLFSDHNKVYGKIKNKLSNLNSDEQDFFKLSILNEDNTKILECFDIIDKEFNIKDILTLDLKDILSIIGLKMPFNSNDLIHDWFMTSRRVKMCNILDITSDEIIGINLSLNFTGKEFINDNKNIIKIFKHSYNEFYREFINIIPEINTELCTFFHPYTKFNDEFCDSILKQISLFKENKDIDIVKTEIIYENDGLKDIDDNFLNIFNTNELIKTNKILFFNDTVSSIFGNIYKVKSFFMNPSSINHYSSDLSYGVSKEYRNFTILGQYLKELKGKFNIYVENNIFTKINYFSKTDKCLEEFFYYINEKSKLNNSLYFRDTIIENEKVSFLRKLTKITNFLMPFLPQIFLLFILITPFFNFSNIIFFTDQIYYIGYLTIIIWFLWIFLDHLYLNFKIKEFSIYKIIKLFIFKPAIYFSNSEILFLEKELNIKKNILKRSFLFILLTVSVSFFSLYLCSIKTLLFWLFWFPCAHLSVGLIAFLIKNNLFYRENYFLNNKIFKYLSYSTIFIMSIIYYLFSLSNPGYLTMNKLNSNNKGFLKGIHKYSSFKTGIPVSIINNDKDQKAVLVEDIGFLAILDHSWAKQILLPTLKINIWNNWEKGFINSIETEKLKIISKEINTENNLISGLAFLHNNKLSYAEYICQNTLIPKIDTSLGGILYGSSSFFNNEGRRFDYIKDSYQNIIAYGFCNSLYKKTKNKIYKDAEDKIKQFIIQMYFESTASFSKRAIFHNDIWIKEQDIFFSVKCSAMSIISLSCSNIELWFGKGSVDKILQQAKNRCYFKTKNNIFLYDSTDPKTNYKIANREFSGFLEETLFMMIASKKAYKYYLTVNMVKQAEKWEKHYNELKNSINKLIYKKDDSCFIPYSILSYKKKNNIYSTKASILYLMNEMDIDIFK